MNKPKVAVLLFGQARYIDINYMSLKKEFAYEDGTPFDIYAHFWENTGFSPKGESEGKIENYTDKIKKATQELNIKKLQINNDDILDEYVDHIENTLRIINKNVFTGTKKHNKKYKWGQHLSLLKAYNLLVSAEKKNILGPPTITGLNCGLTKVVPQQYDIIIKGRTDFTYKDITCYNKEEDYFKAKFNNYLNFNDFTKPIIRTSGVQFQKYNRQLDKWDNNPEVKVKKGECVDFNLLDWKRDKNNIFRIADISLAANRLAATNFFGEHLNVYLKTLLNDYFERDNITYDRHDAIQGDVTYYNKIKVYKTICRFYRIAREWDSKIGWRNVDKNGTIVIPSKEQETYEFVLSEVQRISNIGKEPAPY